MESNRFIALLHMLLALEFLKPRLPTGSGNCIKTHGETTCYFRAGKLYQLDQQMKLESIEVQLAQHGPYLVFVDKQTDEILYDFFLTEDLYMILENKRMAIFLLAHSAVCLKFHNKISFLHFTQSIPSSLYQSCVKNYLNKKKENDLHVLD